MNKEVLSTASTLKEPSQYTILCVDDEANILSSLRRMFSLVGYKVTTAESGAEGLELLGKQKFDVIVSDMRLPNMDGAQFFEAVRARWPETVRILLTGYSDTASAIAAVNQGEIYRYLSKPWVDDELCATVKSALEFAELRLERERLLELTRKQNAELEEKVNERTEHLSEANAKLRGSYISSIKAFSNLLDLRQPNLLIHSRKVAFLSMQMAKLADFEEKKVQEVFIAGLLHDIGKIGMSDRVLRTNISELPVSDLELYKSHPTLGSTCLIALDDMADVAAMIRSHHERYDGKGFPDGLAGDKIPMGARIISIVETYEELLSGDVTKAPLDKDKAQKTIASLSGKYFCPDVTHLFFKALGVQKTGIPSGVGGAGGGHGIVATPTQGSVNSTRKSVDVSPAQSNPKAGSAVPQTYSDNEVMEATTTFITPANSNASSASKGQSTASGKPSKVGSDLMSGPSYAEFARVLKNFPNAVVKDLRDDPNGFLWVFEGMKRYNEDNKLSDWLKSHKFVWSDTESAWYYPII